MSSPPIDRGTSRRLSQPRPFVFDSMGGSTARGPTLEGSGAEALRLVLAITLDREAATECLGDEAEDAAALWPSTLYHLLAVTALASPPVWQRSASRIDAALSPFRGRFEARAPAELAQKFVEGRDVCSGLELAALLWVLVKHPSGAVLGLSRRLGAELETIAAMRLGAPRPARAPAHGHGSDPPLLFCPEAG